jgi:outer membrane lipoprotein-sorting protein
MTPYRDNELGAALRELEAPEHRPEFHAELHRRLAAERTTRRLQRRRRPQVRWVARVAAVAAVVALAAVAFDALRSEQGRAPSVVAVASAAEIQAQVQEALTSAQALSGTLVWDGPQRGDETRWEFLLTARGDFRLSGLTRTDESAYDAERGVERLYSRDEDGIVSAAVMRGLAPGWPDATSSGWMLPDEFGALVRVFLAAKDPAVEEVTTADGRPGWRLRVKAIPNGILPPDLTGDAFTITVDKETGMPVEVTETREGAFRRQIRIEDLAVNPEVSRNAFTLDFPPDAEPRTIDHGFRRVELEDAGEAVGYAPLVPQWAPTGFELAEVAVSPGIGVPGGVEATNPPSTDVVSVSYRRGLDQLLITTRLRNVPDWAADAWTDPLATGEGYRDRPERVRVRRGALSGVELNLLIVPRNVPHIWALTDRLVVTVSGDLSRAELLRISESLEERP